VASTVGVARSSSRGTLTALNALDNGDSGMRTATSRCSDVRPNGLPAVSRNLQSPDARESG
jgi:hypothetical protein